MTLSAVVVFLWTRRLASTPYALVAAGLVLLMPTFAYTGMLMTENAALPAFLLGAFVIARTLERPTLRWQLAVFAAIAAAALLRVQLVTLAVGLSDGDRPRRASSRGGQATRHLGVARALPRELRPPRRRRAGVSRVQAPRGIVADAAASARMRSSARSTTTSGRLRAGPSGMPASSPLRWASCRRWPLGCCWRSRSAAAACRRRPSARSSASPRRAVLVRAPGGRVRVSVLRAGSRSATWSTPRHCC